MGDGHLVVSVDVEWFDSVYRFRGRNPDAPPEIRRLGSGGLSFLLDLFDRYDARGTFYVLGELAESHPSAVGDVDAAGHEVGSHGYSISHPDLRESDPEELSREIGPTKGLLEDLVSGSVDGYRAPAFAMDGEVLDAVADAGFDYDSSLAPTRRIPGFYGAPDAPKRPFRIGTPNGSEMTELPIAVAPYIGLPISGAWMRLLGRRYVLWGIERALETFDLTVLYVHPWEFVDVPAVDAVPRRTTWRTGGFVRSLFEEIFDRWADRITSVRSALDGLELERRPFSFDHR